MTSPAMNQWNLVFVMGSSLGSVTIVANKDIKQQSVGVAVKHHALTDVYFTSRPCQNRINGRERNKKS